MKTVTSVLNTLLISATVLGATRAWAQTVLPQQPGIAHASTGVSVSTFNGQSVVTLNGKEIYRGPTQGAVSSRSCSINGVEYSAVFDGEKLLWENVPGAAGQLESQPGAGGGGIDPSHFAEQHRQAFDRMVKAQRQSMQGHGGMAFGNNIVRSGGSSQGMTRGGSFGPSGGSAHGSGGGFTGGGSSGQSQPLTFGGTRSQSGSPTSPAHPLPITLSKAGDSGIDIKTINGSTVIVYRDQEVSVGPTQGKLSAKARTSQGEDYAAAFEDDRVIWENVPGAAQQLK